MDEATSAIDSLSESAIKKSLKDFKINKTIIIISHRPAIMSAVDKILLLHSGEAKMFDESKKVIKSLTTNPNATDNKILTRKNIPRLPQLQRRLKWV